MPCGAEVQRERSRDLDVPVHDGVVSQEAEVGVTMNQSNGSGWRRLAFTEIVRAEPRRDLQATRAPDLACLRLN